MKVQINIPDNIIDDTERLAILAGKEPKARELFRELRATEEPIDITAFLTELGIESEINQLFISLVGCAFEKLRKNKQ